MLSDNKLYNKGLLFSIQIVNLYKRMVEEKKEFVLSKQLLKSGTSIGANIAEANGGISKADFSSKLSIAYKESLETKYWLELLKETNYISEETYTEYFKNCDELSRIIFSILKTTRINQSTEEK